MVLGVHISAFGKVYRACDQAYALGCNTLQFFSRSPQRWRQDFIGSADIKEFNARRKEFKINPVFIHIPYLINLASPDPRLYNASIQAYIEDILEAQALGADYIVTHMGSHKDTSEDAGLGRLSSALNTIIAKTKGSNVGILLENTSGSGSWLGYKFEHQRQVISRVKEKARLGICLDTAHAYLAGYDIATKDGLQAMVDEIQSLLGLGLVKLIHLNDAKGELGSRYDRHDNIGGGFIGLAGMRRIINHPALEDKPFILETPKETEEADRINLGIVRKLRKK